MASETSVTRTSFTAYFELITDGKSFILRSPGTIPAGPAVLIVRYDDQPEIHRQIEVIGPDPVHAERISIRRS